MVASPPWSTGTSSAPWYRMGVPPWPGTFASSNTSGRPPKAPGAGRPTISDRTACTPKWVATSSPDAPHLHVM
eukprot:7836972-Prorocentrum_lima.AAC.1